MNTETYLNHPTFGLLYLVCSIDEERELYTTLYAQRLFFCVRSTSQRLSFEPISRSDARLLVETRLRRIRRRGISQEYEQLNLVHKRTFQ